MGEDPVAYAQGFYGDADTDKLKTCRHEGERAWMGTVYVRVALRTSYNTELIHA